jgi:subtilisin family serine protease
MAAFITPSSAAASPPAQPLARIDPLVLQQLAANDVTTFWVIMRQKADLSAAYTMHGWNARGRFVVSQLQATANSSQANVRALLRSRGAPFQTFWIANAIRVTAGKGLLRALEVRPDIERIVPAQVFSIPEPTPGQVEATIQSIEWNIDRINAPQVWNTFGDRGEGIVVANVDTGVQFNHPALVAQYRGNQGGGTFDHNFNWFDPSLICGNPSTVPCDNNGHGTHTMGTMVGDDGDPGTNQIGVAPHAQWIAAKGCETNSCSDFALLSSAQWILAPCPLGVAPGDPSCDPNRRPNIVNNSWGGGGGNPWYQASVDAWVASGIFPAFSNGNAGPSCGSAGSPGDYLNTYAAGAFDINNQIAGFSSRGPSAFGGEIKPNIAAPGVNVRSSVPGGYAAFNGTSMASPHVAGTVALIWSAAPALIGDIDGTRALLDGTAIDTDDPQCGGTPGDNNVWGEGRLDAFAAVDQAPRGPTGTLQGTVTDANSGNPIAGVTVSAVGPSNRTTTTDASGFYSVVAPVGTYDVTASIFGYISQTVTGVAVNEGAATTQDFALTPAPSHSVSGTVLDGQNNPVENAAVTITGTPISPATTDANGAYSFASVPEGTYDVSASAGGCNDPQLQTLVVDGDETLDFVLPQHTDAFGYFCRIETPNYMEGDTPLGLSGDDSAVQVDLPFAFTFYGETYNTAYVATNGFLNFLGSDATFSNSSIPSSGTPNAAIYPYWDDMFMDGSASAFIAVLGSAPNRQFVIEWRNVAYFGDFSRRVDFEVVLHENGHILTQYRNIDPDSREQGDSATIGIENDDGSIALQYSFNTPSIGSPDFAVSYRLPPSGFIQGTVTNANDGLPISGASIQVLDNGNLVRATTTDANGFYRTQVPIGGYDVEASASNYVTGHAHVNVQEDQTVQQDFALGTARAEVSPTSFAFVIPVGQTRTQTLTLSNTGGVPMNWQIRETGGGAVSTTSMLGLPRNPNYDPNSRTTQGLYLNQQPAGWSPTSPGDVLASWVPAGLNLPWGVGYNGNVWLSDPLAGGDLCAFLGTCHNVEYTVTGTPTGGDLPADWAGVWNGDMALDTTHNAMCQVNVGGDNGIYCWDLNDGHIVGSITSGAWTGTSQRGLAYRPDDDTFYIGGWNEGILYHIQGLSGSNPGQVINQCFTSDFNISGLAWNSAFNIIWQATNSPTDTIYELNPDTCGVLATLPHPNPGFNGGGLEMDDAGNLWMVSQNAHTVYLVESGVPAFVDVPWLSENPSSGTLAPNGTQSVQIRVDTTGLAPGVYNAAMFVQSNSARQPSIRIPVSLIVPAYYRAVNSGGNAYTDLAGDNWAADRAFAVGSYGYVGQSSTQSTNRAIANTLDDPLYKNLRQRMLEYRFDGLPNGVYEVDLRFAEVSNTRPGRHIFDVLVEGNLVLPAFDIAAEVGSFAADDKVFYVVVTDGQLNIRFITRTGLGVPIINGIQVVHRPDR